MGTHTICINDYLHFKKKKFARLCVTRSLRKGKLTRKSKCEMCNVECKTNAHHVDYGKPLNILWLCDKCHGLSHRSDHPLNPKNNKQTPCAIVWDQSDSITVSLNIPIKQFMVLKEESTRLNKNISWIIRNDIREKYPLESAQMEFNFQENVNDKTQNVSYKDLCSMEQNKSSMLQSKPSEISIVWSERNKGLPRLERKLFDFPYRHGTNSTQLQRASSSG